YWNLLSRERDARAAWAAIEADLYTGNAEQAVKRINTHPIPDELGAALLLRILRKLKETGDAARIVATVEDRGAQPCEPECRYRYAEALAATGNTAKARRLLLQLLHDVPSGVFSQKARILLAQLGGQS
ncbi:MAG: hypothetical protein JXA71_05550, partial [Chitinispirillaceae bacterium]|nr:hypothetical protein [Chitinispirillaceae bacterium]